MAIPPDRYYDLEQTVTWLTRLLYLSLLMLAVGALSTVLELRLFTALEEGRFSSDEEWAAAAEANDTREWIIAIVGLILYIATSVQALTWIYRSAHNAQVRATYMDYTPASCVWWFFIPVAHWWKPYGAMCAIWRESAVQAGRDAEVGRGLLGIWWTFWVLTGLMYQISWRWAYRAKDIDSLRSLDQFELFEGLFDAAATLAFLAVVNGLTRLQREADAKRIAETAGPGVAQVPET